MLIHKFIIHVLDKNSDTPILNDFEGEINEEVEELLVKHISKALKDDDLKKCKFNEGPNIVKECCEEIIYDEITFVDNSKKIANEMFKIIKSNQNISSCDLVICLYSIDDDKYVGLLKLDYKKSYTHSIEFIEEKFKIQIVPNEVGLPSSSQKIKKCAFIGLSGVNDDYHLEVLDRDLNKSSDKEGNFFISNFLNCDIIMDNKDKTKIFRNSTEKWVKNSLYDDIQTAAILRENLVNTLKYKDEVDINNFVDEVIEDENLKESFIEHISREGIEEDNFTIDKDWVEKKLKKKNIKTDTGFEIKGNLEDFEDYLKYQMKQNSDGSVDIIIKNVKFYEEK
ncbi:nucleoid-associated protein [Tepidibacter formicigenes]|uniref:Nucleoid associated protein NdpA n=1 Tax=Tepidibacter formicigenes DSM 15518 TaxID=1123349 RepID=A0A1M6MZZ6_9FIRM|nr:nucleoid-associated protein [Tepidibacter formicigenes]SHJ88923.1 hypothetical protein SAMN02744037_01108 [Tepidibacter formicigenes DSM 15518]